MKKLISCAFNMDAACVELHFTDGSIYSINCTAVENEMGGSSPAHSLTFSCCMSVVFSCVFSVFLFIPRRQLRLPFAALIIRLDHGQQAAGDAFNGVIRDLHATVFPTAEC